MDQDSERTAGIARGGVPRDFLCFFKPQEGKNKRSNKGASKHLATSVIRVRQRGESLRSKGRPSWWMTASPFIGRDGGVLKVGWKYPRPGGGIRYGGGGSSNSGSVGTKGGGEKV